ncbi:hypothetical protein Y032_0002g904 [Ancylostoma ceylanicum]|uniref:Uncharacterized protein n=1 Tax=Ancylostoma ceylanicum TaxID=53326 RepID=A0A016W228_9BILA|nr:hypothetical protein Y032_0002g904 [Ancylostoma ceylanicum]
MAHALSISARYRRTSTWTFVFLLIFDLQITLVRTTRLICDSSIFSLQGISVVFAEIAAAKDAETIHLNFNLTTLPNVFFLPDNEASTGTNGIQIRPILRYEAVESRGVLY